MYRKLARHLARFLGLISILSASAVFYYFGRTFVSQYEFALSGEFDVFFSFITLSSFFLGLPALLWVGYRMLRLLSFSINWLTYVCFPAVAGLMLVFDTGRLYAMDEIMTSFVMYIIVFALLRFMLGYIHEYWYTPLSHDDPRHVGTIELEPPTAYKSFLQVLLIVILLFTLLVAHPNDLATSTRMLLSPIMHLIEVVSSYIR